MVNQATQLAEYVSQMCFELHKLASTTTELSFEKAGRIVLATARRDSRA